MNQNQFNEIWNEKNHSKILKRVTLNEDRSVQIYKEHMKKQTNSQIPFILSLAMIPVPGGMTVATIETILLKFLEDSVESMSPVELANMIAKGGEFILLGTIREPEKNVYLLTQTISYTIRLGKERQSFFIYSNRCLLNIK